MQVNNSISKQIEYNKAIFKSILDISNIYILYIIILCRRQNISLLGHDEYSTDLNSNIGNFNALLKRYINSGNVY